MQPYLKHFDVADLLHKAISERKPFSLVRLGDGEARLMGYPETFGWPSVSEMMKIWFGHPFFPDAAIRHLQRDLKAACLAADVLGLVDPATVTEVDRANPFKAAALLVRDHGCLRADTCLTSPGIHMALERNGHYDRLLNGLEEVVLITPRAVADAVAERFAIPSVTHIPIPPEMQYSDLTPVDKLETAMLAPHFPTRYLEVSTLIEGHVRKRPGITVLVGAGVLGKVYCGWVKAAGGVGIDIGSVFDLWAGLRTRSGEMFAGARLARDPTATPSWLVGPERGTPPAGTGGTASQAEPVEGHSVLVFEGILRPARLAPVPLFRCRVNGVPAGSLADDGPVAGARRDGDGGSRFRVAFRVPDEAWPPDHGVALEVLDRRGDWHMVGSTSDPEAPIVSLRCLRHRLVRFPVPHGVLPAAGGIDAALCLNGRIPAGHVADAALTPLPLGDAAGYGGEPMRIRMVINRSALRDGRITLLLPASSADGVRMEFPGIAAFPRTATPP